MSNLSTWRKLLVFGTAVILFSCQKEYNGGRSANGGGAASAAGTLGVASGVCTRVTIGGTYKQGVSLTSANTITVQVTVTTPGPYTVSTNTVNEISFSNSGTFTTTGLQNLTLMGTGTPTNSGSQNFAVTFGNSTCNFSITFAATAPATGTLGGSPGSCTPVTPAGIYIQGVTLTAANTIQIQVNVATVGTYTISTNTVNGVSFLNSGTFTTTGLQNVTLTGTGTPIISGSQNFTVTFGSSTCNFSIIFGTGATAIDYFPVTINSYWAYQLQGGGFSDTFLIKVFPYILSAGGNNYSTFYTPDFLALHSPDSLYYRKPGGDYIEYINTAESFGLDGPNVENTFLKDNVPQGTTWNSPDITGTYNGISYTFFIKMTLFEKITTPTTIGVVTSSDILKVRYEYFNTVAPATPTLIEERWFAKGIGMIYNSLTYRTTGTATNTDIYHVERYQVF
jgi:hypothetical protein